MACFLFLKSGTELEPFERLRKNPGRLFAGAGTARVFELEDGACEALDPASDLSDRLPEKTAARRRMVEDVEVDERACRRGITVSGDLGYRHQRGKDDEGR